MKAVALASAGTKRGAVLRSLLTPFVSAPGFIAAVIFAGAGSPMGLVLAAPPLYLLWVWLVDLYALCASLFGPQSFAERSRYIWFATASVLPFIAFWCWNRYF